MGLITSKIKYNQYEQNYNFLNTIFLERGISKIILKYKFELELTECDQCNLLSKLFCKNCSDLKNINICIKCCKTSLYSI